MRKYIKPEIEIIEIAPDMMIATSIFIDVEQEEEGKADVIEKRRGTWGDLWAENPEEELSGGLFERRE